MSKFQVVLLSFFGFFIVLAVIVFAFYRGGAGNLSGTVAIWGSLPSESVEAALSTTLANRNKDLTVQYVEKSRESLHQEFTEALARGEGPDLLILSQEDILQEKPKLLALPYESISERDFKEVFVEEGELFLWPEGIYGLPLVVDPLVLYHNRDTLSSAGLSRPIAYWDEIYNVSIKLVKKDGAGNITQSAIALGETINIPHIKEILSLLFLQAGTPITSFSNGELRSMLAQNFDLPVTPGVATLDFYTQFSNPLKPYYTWNKTLQDAQTNFTSGDAAYYLGFASELNQLRSKNPTLNVAVTAVPQSRVANRSITYGNIYAIALTRGTKNPATSFETARALISKEFSQALAQNLGLPSARRDLLASPSSGASQPIFYEAALQARGWLDPEKSATRAIFEMMVNDVTSGRSRTSEAIYKADGELSSLIK